MAIQIAQYKGKSLTSRIIRFITWSEYSHTAIILAEDTIVEAWEGCNQVRIVSSLSEGHTAGTTVDIYDIRMGTKQEEKFREFIAEQVGKKYDYWGILGFLRRRDLERGESWFCSELFAAACQEAGVVLLHNCRPAQTSPGLVTRSPITNYVRTIVTSAL